MQKITPHLWFDKEAKEAAELYTSVFENSKVKNITTLHDTPSGDADMVTIELAGQKYMLISAGPYFTFNPSISFLVGCDTKEEVDRIWEKLSPGGNALMELGSYPFSGHYGWIQDKYGLSWQVMYTDQHKMSQKITPTMMFVGDVCGRAEEAINFYISVFQDAPVASGESKVTGISRYEAGREPDKEGTVMFGGFMLAAQHFAAMDSAYQHAFKFNEAVSFIIHCDDQKEVDYYWDKLSADPKAEQCGWLKDKFGLSWQVVPTAMDKMFAGGDKEKIARVTEAFLKMKKFDIAKLEEAAKGK